MRTRTIFVHGFQYDPKAVNNDNPLNYTYPRWKRMLGDIEDYYFTWYSVPIGINSVWEAWKHGYWNRYRWAWDLAKKEQENLAKFITEINSNYGECNILCHSLGTRVVLGAIKSRHNIKRILLLNGAEYSNAARMIATARPSIKFYNSVVKEDDVLHKLGRFAPPMFGGGGFIGQKGLEGYHPDNWVDINLDDPKIVKWGDKEGMDLRGDNPHGWGDHWYTFEHSGNWKLWRGVFSGEYDDFLFNKGVK